MATPFLKIRTLRIRPSEITGYHQLSIMGTPVTRLVIITPVHKLEVIMDSPEELENALQLLDREVGNINN